MEFNGDIYDGPHTSIAGTTGSGKSTLAVHLYENAPGIAIYVNTDAEDGIAGHTIDFAKGDKFDPSVFKDNQRINFIPPGTSQDDEAIAALQKVLFDLGDAIPHDKGRFHVFIDEAHEYAPLSADKDNPVVRMAKRGRRRNIRLYPISQSPSDVSKSVLRECNQHIIFAIGTYSENYFRTYGMPADEIREKVGHKDKHQFVIWDDFEVHGPFRLSSTAL